MMRVRITQTLVKTLASVAILLAAVATTPVAQADGYRNYCEQEAQRLSGYKGKAGDIIGGAIKGAVRADVFWGPGARAARMAGGMKSPGRYWFLQPRNHVLPRGS